MQRFLEHTDQNKTLISKGSQKAAARPIFPGIFGTFLVCADSFYKRPSSEAEDLEGEFEGQRAS